MIKIICDKCGQDCGLNAYDILISALHNPVPASIKDIERPTATTDSTHIRFTLCQDCYKSLGLPNIYTCANSGNITFRDDNRNSASDCVKPGYRLATVRYFNRDGSVVDTIINYPSDINHEDIPVYIFKKIECSDEFKLHLGMPIEIYIDGLDSLPYLFDGKGLKRPDKTSYV